MFGGKIVVGVLHTTPLAFFEAKCWRALISCGSVFERHCLQPVTLESEAANKQTMKSVVKSMCWCDGCLDSHLRSTVIVMLLLPNNASSNLSSNAFLIIRFCFCFLCICKATRRRSNSVRGFADFCTVSRFFEAL